MTDHVPAFEEYEDNNPFSHTQGLSSIINSNSINTNNNNNNNNNTSATSDKVNQLATETDKDGAEESILLYNNGNSEGYNRVHINYESRVTKLLKPHSKIKIQITEANNSNEGVSNSSKKYIVYTIKLISMDNPNDDIQTRRRYSDFESLRDILTKIFPLVIVPPIPPKNYFNLNVLNGLVNSSVGSVGVGNGTGVNSNIPSGTSSKTINIESSTDDSKAAISSPNGNYAYINSNHLNKQKLVEHRKRLLSNFLNNCLNIPQIRNLEFFAKFLDPNANWSDEIALITSQLPKSVYQSNPENGLRTDPIYSNMPLPINHMSFLNKLKKIDDPINITTNSQTGAIDSEIIDTTLLDEINKRIMENFMGLSTDYTDLGSLFNLFSIDMADTELQRSSNSNQSIKLNLIFDKIGQVFDRSYITLNSLINDLETKFSEPLGEAVRYSSTLQSIRKFKDRKDKQSILLNKELLEKKKEYNNLLKLEEESSRISKSNSELQQNVKYDLKSDPNSNDSTTSSKGKYSVFSMSKFKKLTQYVSDIIDQNPEETRRQKLSTLQVKIGVLEECQIRMAEDIAYITDELEKNFDLFHHMQLKMIYKILVCYNGFLIDWAKKNLEIWEEIKEEIEKL